MSKTSLEVGRVYIWVMVETKTLQTFFVMCVYASRWCWKDSSPDACKLNISVKQSWRLSELKRTMSTPLGSLSLPSCCFTGRFSVHICPYRSEPEWRFSSKTVGGSIHWVISTLAETKGLSVSGGQKGFNNYTVWFQHSLFLLTFRVIDARHRLLCNRCHPVRSVQDQNWLIFILDRLYHHAPLKLLVYGCKSGSFHSVIKKC